MNRAAGQLRFIPEQNRFLVQQEKDARALSCTLIS